MEILYESPNCYIQQCHECGAVFKYSLCDIHVNGKPHFVDGQMRTTSFASICCPCCSEILPATKQWFYDAFLPQKPTTT